LNCLVPEVREGPYKCKRTSGEDGHRVGFTCYWQASVWPYLEDEYLEVKAVVIICDNTTNVLFITWKKICFLFLTTNVAYMGMNGDFDWNVVDDICVVFCLIETCVVLSQLLVVAELYPRLHLVLCTGHLACTCDGDL